MISVTTISGGRCVWKRVLKEDEVPNLHVQQAEESKDCLFPQWFPLCFR